MNLKQLMLLRLFLKRSLKKNNYIKLIVIGFCLFLWGVNNLYSLSAQLSAYSDGNIVIKSSLSDIDIVLFFESLNEEYESEVEIQIQIFKKRELPYSIIGDELIEKIEVRKTSEIDFFSDSYIIKDNGLISYFENQENFLDHFFNSEITVPFRLSEKEDLNRYYIKFKATLINRIYIQPFNIFYLISSRYRSSTGWIKTNLTREYR